MLQQTFRGRGALRTLFLVPYALPIYAGMITWSFMFQRDNGMVNHLLLDDLHISGTRAVLADRQPGLLLDGHRGDLAVRGRSPS